MNDYSKNSTSKISTDSDHLDTEISPANAPNDSLSNKRQSPETQNNSVAWWQRPKQFWNNIPIRAKTTILLIVTATVPVIAVTQGIVEVSRREALKGLENRLETELTLLEEEIYAQKQSLEANANTLALSVRAANINLDNADSVAANSQKLQSFIEAAREQTSNASFYMITDGRGRTVAQYVQAVEDDGLEYPLLPTETSSKTQLQSVQLESNIPLGDVPIVNNALELSRPLSGFELLSSDVLKRIGLDWQASIGIRYQNTEGLPEPKQPYPEGTFDIDGGKAGFVLMAVKPIRLENNEVGTAIVGTLVNNNFELVDRLKEITGVPTATIFAQDWRVSTNVPYTDKETRAIGTRVSRVVADTVLNKEQVFLGNANIIGIEYLTGYSPIYNHLQQINEEEAKPVGIAYVGEPQTQVAQELKQITLAGYTVGGVVLLVVVTALILAPSDKSIPRLTEFATQVASGESGVRLNITNRKDEIGVLTYSLNEMAQNIDANLEARQREAERQRQERERLEREIFQLLVEISDATEGDLTVRASLSSMEMSTVADLFNAIIDSLQEIAIEAKQSTSQVGSSLQENEQAIRALAEQAIREAQETRDTLLSIEQMSQSIREVAENASQAAAIADDTNNTVLESSNAMDLTVDSILNLRTTVGVTAKKMKRLGESSQKISQAVSLIEEIALRTNLLAINASVEASRAGEQGQGFTVVAEQVAALAEQSAAATKEIATIVADIQLETQEVSEAMETGTTQVVDTTRMVESTKQSLAVVLSKSQEINQLMRSIAQATESQTDTSQSVTKLMQQIAQLSEASSLSSKQVAESMVATAQVAQSLETSVAKFKVAKSG